MGHKSTACSAWVIGSFSIKLEQEAQQNVERCKKEDAIAETAHLLVENAVKALMQLNGLDRDTAERAIRDVMGGARLQWKQFF
jgi:hypothetical protein